MIQKALIRLKHGYRWVLGKCRLQTRQRSKVIFEDDTFLVSYPRSGSGWLRRLIASMRDPQADINIKNIRDYVPYVNTKEALRIERPRIMKSHASYQRSYPRVIYLVRDGRDVAVSYYNYHQTLKGYRGSFEEFLKRFLGGDLMFGSWQDHVMSWVFRRHAIPFMAVRYERLYEDPYNCLREVADFVHLDTDDTRIGLALRKYTFERHKNDVRRNSRLREKGYCGGVRGGPGAWKEIFNDDLLDLFWAQSGEVMERLGYNGGKA